LRVFEGGGEYNVARGLRRCFGLRTAIVTALADNPVGRLVEDLMLQGGVDLRFVRWREFDGVGREVRNGLNFVERGFGPRGALGCSDRGNTAVSQLEPGQIDWNVVFEAGVRCLHTGGVFAALSDTTALVAREAMLAAQRHGTRVSYDLNYRDSLWRGAGGEARAQNVNRSLVAHADVLLGNEQDFASALGYAVDARGQRELLRRVAADYPQLSTIALRTGRSAPATWSASVYHEGELYEASQPETQILDRIGGGDAFASGFLYGLLHGSGPAWALECALAHRVLAMSTPGDTSMATLSDVLRVMSGTSARVER
jgi:2-dehydro-3-deoxygluconokinase